MTINLEGLPGNVLAVRIGTARPGEFLFEHGNIWEATGSRVGQGLIVEAAHGFEFVYQVTTDTYLPVRKFDTPKILLAKFELSNTHQEVMVRKTLEKLPGFQFCNDMLPLDPKAPLPEPDPPAAGARTAVRVGRPNY